MKRRKKNEKDIDSRCPWCGKFNEGMHHILRCWTTGEKRTKMWNDILTSLQNDSDTCSFVITIFASGMQQRLSEWLVKWEGSLLVSEWNDAIGQATFETFLNQQDIGWNQVFRGRISEYWTIANSLYCCEQRLHDKLATDQILARIWCCKCRGLA
jgi:hypothetical protein